MTQSIKPDIACHVNKLQKQLPSKIGRAMADFNIIAAGDKIMLCLSGGKDSYGKLDMLLHLQQHAPVDVCILGVRVKSSLAFPSKLCLSILSIWQ
jgi:tRNA 2-thiocytidine biosynthesis protein TtcA